MNYVAGKAGFRSSSGQWAGVVFHYWLFPALLLFAPVVGCAQAYHISVRSIEILNGCARVRPEVFAAGVNPAVLGATRTAGFEASSENAWALPELRFSRIMAILPVANGALGMALQHSGNPDYQESGADFGYGLSLGKSCIGLFLNYRQFQAAGYRSVSSGSAVAGFRVTLLPKLLTGFSFAVPFSIFQGTDRADRPSGDYRIEIGYLASEQVSLFAAWVKTDGLVAAAEIGLDYAFANHFFFIAGMHGRTAAPFGKTGWGKNGWRLALFTAYQAPLGFSPGIALSWHRPGKKETAASKTGLP